LFSIGAQLSTRGWRVLYFVVCKPIADRYRVEDIERAADQVVWCCEEPPGFTPGRPRDLAFVRNVVQRSRRTARALLGRPTFRWQRSTASSRSAPMS
jgi:hypothetical protein